MTEPMALVHEGCGTGHITVGSADSELRNALVHEGCGTGHIAVGSADSDLRNATGQPANVSTQAWSARMAYRRSFARQRRHETEARRPGND